MLDGLQTCMRGIMLTLLFLCLASIARADEQAPASSAAQQAPKDIVRALASGDGKTRQTAYVIDAKDEAGGVAKEYAILRYLELKPGMQSLVADKKPYDVIEVTDSRTGETRKVWFDISGFFGKLF
jgi:hypothetical protein